MTKEQDDAQRLLDSRLAVYGDRIDNMERTAKIWSGLLGVDITPVQVPVMMAAYKQLRMMMAPDYSDNIDDSDGWMKMAREILGDDLIQARTVEEYVTLKEARRLLREQGEVSAALSPAPESAQADGENIDRWVREGERLRRVYENPYRAVDDDDPEIRQPSFIVENGELKWPNGSHRKATKAEVELWDFWTKP